MLNRSHFLTRRNYWAAVGAELAAPALRVASRLASGPATPPSAWRRGLILGHTHIGDVLYRTCSLPHLRRLLPDCEWDYLAAPLSAPLLRGNPHVASVLPLNVGERTWRLTDGGFRALRTRGYDVVLCTNSTGHAPDFLLAAALGVPNRVGFTYKGLSGLVTLPVEIPYPAPFPAYFRAMVAQIGGTPASWPLAPQLEVDDADEREAAAVWEAERLSEARVVVACTLTTRQRGAWPASYLLGALRQVREEAGAEVVVCGSADEAPQLSRAVREARIDARVLAGRLSLRGFAAFLRRCALLVSADSGPRHIGNAVGTPVAFARNLCMIAEEVGRYCDNEIDLAPAGTERLDPREVPAALARHPIRVVADRILAVLDARGARCA